MTKKEKVLEYVKNHKKEILISACVVIGGAVLYKVCKTNPIAVTNAVEFEPVKCRWPEHFEVPGFSVGKLDDALRYQDGMVELWADGIDLDNMGKLGEEIHDLISDLPEHPDVWALMCIREKRTTT